MFSLYYYCHTDNFIALIMLLLLISCFNAAEDLRVMVDENIEALHRVINEGPVERWSALSAPVRMFFNDTDPTKNNTYSPRDSNQIAFLGDMLNGKIVAGTLKWRDCEHKVGAFLGVGGYREYPKKILSMGDFEREKDMLRREFLLQLREAERPGQQAPAAPPRMNFRFHA